MRLLNRNKLILLAILILGVMNILMELVVQVVDFGTRKVSSSESGHITYKYLGYCSTIPPTYVNDSEIMALMNKVTPIKCGRDDWVKIYKSRAFIKKRNKSNVFCAFQDILRASDSSNKGAIATHTNSKYELRLSDFVLVKCYTEREASWTNVMAGIRYDESIWNRASWEHVPPFGLRLNVLMFAIDSVSRLMFERKLPKTVRYLRESLKAIEFTGYNAVGDGTFNNILPLLTGKEESELPSTRLSDKNSKHVDVYPFVWKEYKKLGYVTGYIEDCPEIGTFAFRHKGFDKPPTDHYGRPFYVTARHKYPKNEDFCLGGLPRHKILMNYVTNFFRMYRSKPKFMFAFSGELSHTTYNHIGVADEDIRDWLEMLHKERHLDNTLLIVMSDHGPRYTKLRNTKQGRLEERLPMMSFVLPPMFVENHPYIAANLRNNAPMLTTPFDVHETLLDVLDFGGTDEADFTDRSCSLFRKITETRSCEDVQLSVHWCTCVNWREIYWEDRIVQEAATIFVDGLRKVTAQYRYLCAELSLLAIHEAYLFIPEDKDTSIVFNPSDPNKPKIIDELEVVFYRMNISVSPGNGLYDVTVPYFQNQKTFHPNDFEMTRINPYGPFTKCLEGDQLHLQKFCVCLNDLATSSEKNI